MSTGSDGAVGTLVDLSADGQWVSSLNKGKQMEIMIIPIFETVI